LYNDGGEEVNRLLLDTNVLLFHLFDEGQLTKKVRHLIGDYSNEVYVSSESVRELMNLLQSGRIRPKELKSAEDVIDFINDKTRFVIKYVKEEHFRTFSKLPFYDDHRDQRDRMIIAHAITENLILISSDTKFFRYERNGLNWVYNNKK